MPLVQYFVWVGSALLALLFAVDAWLPRLPPPATIDALPPAIRVHSDQKWPERVVYDTSARMPEAPSAATTQADNSASAKTVIASPKSREALAELRTTVAVLPVNPKRPEAGRQRRRATSQRNPRQDRWLLAARRSPFGWFGPMFW